MTLIPYLSCHRYWNHENKHWYTRHFMFGYHCYMHISMCLLWLWTLLFYILVSLLYGYFITPDTVISYTCIIITRIPYYTRHCYFIFLSHRYIDSPEFITWLFLYQCYINIYRILISDCSYITIIDMLLTWLLLANRVGLAIDIRCVN